jgi:fumarate reductase subunit D
MGGCIGSRGLATAAGMTQRGTMHKRSNEPFVWLLFSAGGVVAALLIPIHLFLFGLAFPLGWLNAPTYDSVRALAGSPIGRIYLFVLCMLPLFHWAHRFRYTLYDGLQIKHLDELVNTLCYGGAIVGTIIAGYLIWRIP